MPTEKMDNNQVWYAVALDMPIMALIRNLATLTRVGTVTHMNAGWLANSLYSKVSINKRVINPINILSALLTYRSGKGVRGHHSWDPIPRISSALGRGVLYEHLTRPHRPTRGSIWL